ncbi:WD40 repeat-like protein, partial [Myriangium duriaei CBS 260.36]
ACIASPSSLVLFDNSTLSVTRHVKNCHDSVTAIAAANQHVATAGRDGLVKLWDDRSKDVNATLVLQGDGKGLSAVAVSEHLVAAGTENTRDGPGDVSVLVWDIRSPTSTLRSYADSHNDTITTLGFHPSDHSMLLSSSTDALLTLFNTSVADEDDAVTQVFNNAAAVHCASFLAADEVGAISSDEQMSIYQRSRPEDIERDDVVAVETRYGDVRTELNASYVVDLIRTSSAADAETWVVGGDLESRSITITPLVRQLAAGPTKWMFEHRRAVTFPGGHGEEIVRDVLLLPDHRVLTCGEDGTVRMWTV